MVCPVTGGLAYPSAPALPAHNQIAIEARCCFAELDNFRTTADSELAKMVKKRASKWVALDSRRIGTQLCNFTCH